MSELRVADCGVNMRSDSRVAWRDFLHRHGITRCYRVEFNDAGGLVHCYTDPVRLDADGQPTRMAPRWVNWTDQPPQVQP